MDESVRIDREGAQSSAEVVDGGGSALSKKQKVGRTQFCTMSSWPLSVLLQHCMKVALRNFPGFQTYDPPCANFACSIPCLTFLPHEFAQFNVKEAKLAAKGMMSSASCERNFRMPRENHVLASAILRQCLVWLHVWTTGVESECLVRCVTSQTCSVNACTLICTCTCIHRNTNSHNAVLL